jgi:L,D-transpeptidase catalytic domain
VAGGLSALRVLARDAAPRQRAGTLIDPALPAAPRPALDITGPRALDDRALARFSPVRTATVARVRPDAGAPVAARLAAMTPEGTRNLVLLLGERRRDRAGHLWLRARLPALRHRTGWVRRAALGGYEDVHTRLVIDRRRLRATLWRNGRAVLRAPIGVGAAATPTPAGDFYVRDRVTRYASPTYGPLAFGTSARSAVLTDWPGGGFVGIHGTDRPGLLPGRVSHGCVRMRNADIVALGRLMPVGTPITIR